MTISYTRQQIIRKTVNYLFCVLLSIFVLIPVYLAVTGGFKTMGQLMTDPMGLPLPADPSYYINLVSGKIGSFWRSMGNSLLIAAGTVIINLLICTMAAFALARIKFKGNSLFRNYFMLGLLFPLAVAILPLYLQIRTLGLLDSYLGVILPQVAFQIPMTVLLLRGFFAGIPTDLEDACSIDGSGPLGFLFRMVIPLSTPILATAGVITLVASWNNFFLPLLIFNTNSFFTLPMGVMEFQGQHMTDWNMILAYLSLAMIPAVALFIGAQRYIISGLTGGAVKG